MPSDAGWFEILPGLFRFRDSCNVYGIVGPEGVVIVNAGTGRWLERLDDLPADSFVLLCTHFFRDHTAGAAAAAAKGLQVYVPALEYSLIAEPELHFLRRETYNLYHHYWDHFVPIRETRVAGVLVDY
jgi:glyoxylase-like metal-dependent hydrolase (beta-lactamase superfamily II)